MKKKLDDSENYVKATPEMNHIKSTEDLQDLMFESLMGCFLVKEEDIEEWEKMENLDRKLRSMNKSGKKFSLKNIMEEYSIEELRKELKDYLD